MGNCFLKAKSITALVQEEETPEPSTMETEGFGESISIRPVEGVKKKVVSFKLNDEEDSRDDEKSGVVRFRIVVTKQELKEILNSERDSDLSSMEDLLNAMNATGARITQLRTISERNASSSGWRPALESIPENNLGD